MDVTVQRYFVLQKREPMEVYNLKSWQSWMKTSTLRVASTELKDGTLISTAFIGRCLPTESVKLFETAIYFHPNYHGQFWRWESWDEAVRGHQIVVNDLIRPSLKVTGR